MKNGNLMFPKEEDVMQNLMEELSGKSLKSI